MREGSALDEVGLVGHRLDPAEGEGVIVGIDDEDRSLPKLLDMPGQRSRQESRRRAKQRQLGDVRPDA